MSAAVSRLPRRVSVGRRRPTLRLMETSDRDQLLRFARALPERDLVFLRRDITREDVIDEWVDDIAKGDVTTVLAISGSEVLGYATVHVSHLNWSRHVAELRVLVGEKLRGEGLGRRLTEEAFRVAVDRGVEKLTAQMPVDQLGAIVTFKNLSFTPEGILHDHVKDRDGKKRDLLVMSLDLIRFAAQLQTYGLADEALDS